MNKRGNTPKLPLPRKLFAGSIACLAGIYLAKWVCFPAQIVIFAGAFCVGAGMVCLYRHQSALAFFMLLALLMGNARTGAILAIRDNATAYGVRICGVVSEKLTQTRVVLTDVTIDGETALNRPAAVTLMLEKDDEGNLLETRTVEVGQTVSGTGRLFEPEAVRNPGGIDRRIQALCDGYELSGYILPGWTAEGEARFSLKDMLQRIRTALSERISGLFGENAALFQAVLVGDRSQMEPQTVRAMQLSGIAHLLTISGMHLSLIAYALSAGLRRMPLNKHVSFATEAVLLGLFAGMTGGAPGTVRAYVMAMMRTLARRTGRRYDPLTALAAAALLMTAVNPVIALSASFQFSFFVVLGIQLLNRQIFTRLVGKHERPEVVRRAMQSLAVCLSAQIAALPMQLALYGYVPLLALPMNLLCGMAMPALLLGGWGTLLLSAVLPGPAKGVARVLGCAAAKVESLSALAASVRWATLRLPAPYMATVALAGLLLAAYSTQIFPKKGKLRFLIGALLITSYAVRFDLSTQYVQLDVGQGDAAVIRSGRQAVLVDVGPEDEYAALRYLRSEGLFVDAVILSHLDEDHAGALGVLLDSEVEIGRIVMAVGAEAETISEPVRAALALAAEKGIRVERYQQGDTIEAGGFAFDVLSPDDTLSGSNERSLALFAQLDGMRLLTLGDLPAECEMDDVPECDVLKASHHGSRYATSRRLLEASRPSVVLISVGQNSYGHPSSRVLDDALAVGAGVYRTDLSGCLSVKWTADGCQVKPYIR